MLLTIRTKNSVMIKTISKMLRRQTVNKCDWDFRSEAQNWAFRTRLLLFTRPEKISALT